MSSRHSYSDSYAMSHGLWVIIYDYFILLKRFLSSLWTRLGPNFFTYNMGSKIAFEINQPDLTHFDTFHPSLTSDNFYGLIWSEITLNFNAWQHDESKHMYIWYISTNRSDLTPIGRLSQHFLNRLSTRLNGRFLQRFLWRLNGH